MMKKTAEDVLRHGVEAMAPEGADKEAVAAFAREIAEASAQGPPSTRDIRAIASRYPQLRKKDAPPLRRLTPQQRRVLVLVTKGMDDVEIGNSLKLSPDSVGTIVLRIMDKLHATSRSQLVTEAKPTSTVASAKDASLAYEQQLSAPSC